MRAAVVTIAILGCHHGEPPARPALHWVEHPSSGRHEPIAVRFELDPAGTSGTVVVLDLLRAALDRGAREVSNVAIVIQLRRGGTPVECVSRIGFAGEPPAPPPMPPSFVPAEIEVHVVDRELHCNQEQVLSVGSPELGTGSELGASTPRGGPPQPFIYTEWQEKCAVQPVERTVKRHDHFVAAHFAPPDLAKLGAIAGRPLVESPPVCHPVQTSIDGALRSRVEAEIGRGEP